MTKDSNTEKEKEVVIKKKKKKANPNKKNTKGLYLAINIFAFLSCWVAAMGFISWFDSPVLIFLLFSIVAGYLQGSIREIINIISGSLALIGAWLLAVLTVDSIFFGFFLSKLQYAYIVWFIIFTPFCWFINKKIVYYIVVKSHKIEAIKKLDEKTGFIVGVIKGILICYVYVAILHFSNVENIAPIFEAQAENSIALKYFKEAERDYAIVANIDTTNTRYYISDISTRWKFYNIAGEIYPGDYKTQRYLLDIVAPLIYDSKSLVKFYTTNTGQEIIAILKKKEEAKKAWQKDKHTRNILQKEEHSSTEILITLHQKFIQEVLQLPELIEFVKKK